MLPRSAAYVVFPAATAGGVLAAWFFAQGELPDPTAELDAGSPHRCASLDDAGAPSGDHILHLEPDRETLAIGVVADARGATTETLERLRRARRAFRDADVDLVLSLGGMGEERAELESLYSALARGAPWQVVAIPGDREPWPTHRNVIAELGPTHPLRDGSSIRIIVAGAVTVATFPGVADPSQLVAGSEGCTYEAADADALAAWLERREGSVVWAAYAPPRQRGAEASDRVRGIHIGDPDLARAVRASGASLVLHGLIDEAALHPGEDVRRLDSEGFFALAPGPIEALPLLGADRGVASGTALIARVSPERVEWERIDLAAKSHADTSENAPRTSE